jgi:hypothetical protein
MASKQERDIRDIVGMEDVGREPHTLGWNGGPRGCQNANWGMRKALVVATF